MSIKYKKKTTKKLSILTQFLEILKKLLIFIGKPIYALLFFLLTAVLLIPTISKNSFLTAKKYLNKHLRVIEVHKKKGIVKKTKRYSIGYLLALVSLVIFVTSALLGGLFYEFILKDLPDPNSLANRDLPVSTKIYDRNGELLYTVYKDHNRTPVKLSEIPQSVKLATIAIEDAEFYDHPGFSLRGIIRSIKRNSESGELTGGSTITQQLVKNTLLSSEKTYVRKTKEIILAILVERIYTKDQILEMYLNEIPFGGTAYGVQEAAQTFFGKNIADVNLAEAALLAGLPKSPTRYSPFGNTPELSLRRQREVLKLMEQNGFITENQRLVSQDTPLVFAEYKTEIKAPHFVSYIKEALDKQYGQNVLETGGLHVITTLDYSIQKFAETVLTEELEKLKKLHVTNGAVVVLEPESGEILAMVGSKNYFDTPNGGNVNVTTRLRQPGSAIKVVNYAYALSHGMNPATIIEDTPVTFLVDGQEPYTPKNYEGGFKGKITIRNALAESRNIPAVRVLQTNGIENVLQLGRDMGITSWNNNTNYGLSLTLGGGEVTLIDLARVYATLANYGSRPPLTPIRSVTNFKNELLHTNLCSEMLLQYQNTKNADKTSVQESITQAFNTNVIAASTNDITYSDGNPCKNLQVLDPRVAFMITDILRDNKARTPAFGSNSLLVVDKHPEVAVKTGTSNDLRDNLAIGYTKDYVVAVWVGNNDNSQMHRIASGVTGATPIWNKIISGLLQDKEAEEWKIPEGIIEETVCPYTGTQACKGCANIKEYFLKENTPEKMCRYFLNVEEIKNQPLVVDTPRKNIIDLREINIKFRNTNR